jgi:putative ATPase
MGLFDPPTPSDDAAPGSGAGRPREPLADRMRPRTLEELVGQPHLVGPGRPLTALVAAGRLPSMILWGPPGSGKTTLATLLASGSGTRFVTFSAVLAGVADVRRVVEEARLHARSGRATTLFVDEIHRFNKKQQDAFLPHVESGLLTLVGATTENPSFEVNAALLSRCRIYTLEPLDDDAVRALVERACDDAERGLGDRGTRLDEEAMRIVLAVANGDARTALNVLETAADALGERGPADATGEGGAGPAAGGARTITADLVRAVCQSGRALAMDKGGEEHYNLASAYQKSIRGSDAQAALYWLARMLEAGEDPLFVARRLVRTASEDVGNADPAALPLAMAARDAAHFLGMPEASAALAQATVYLATAPKSNASAAGYDAAARDARETRAEPVPLHIRNAATRLMKELGYGEGYRYDHEAPEGFAGLDFLPTNLAGRTYYAPVERGFEREVRRRMVYWERLRTARRAGEGDAAAEPDGEAAAGESDPTDRSGEGEKR